ncbi:MAG: hypothetical protein ACREH5_05050, partial [Candidatus Omnitrophota bacterium]
VQAYGALPENKRAIRRLAAVKESAGEWKEALDLHIAGYEPAESPGLDVNRAVIEALYRKVNGSLDGLDKRIGSASIMASTAKLSAKAPDPKPNRTAVKKEPLIKPSLPSRQPAERETEKEIAGRALPATPKAEAPPQIIPAASSVPAAEARQPVENPTVSTAFTEPAPIIRKSMDKPGDKPGEKRVEKPVELPAISAIAGAPFTITPLINPVALHPALEFFLQPAFETEGEIPPPPVPQVHTRKRRVTAPDNQPPSN